MIIAIKIVIVAILSILYAAYLLELHRQLTNPINNRASQFKPNKFILFIIGVGMAIATSLYFHKYIVPQPVIDLLSVSLQIVFVMPFFSALLTDRLMYVWKKHRLPYPITIIIILGSSITACISNMLILFGSQDTIANCAQILSRAADYTTLLLIAIFAIFVLAYAMGKMSRKQ